MVLVVYFIESDALQLSQNPRFNALDLSEIEEHKEVYLIDIIDKLQFHPVLSFNSSISSANFRYYASLNVLDGRSNAGNFIHLHSPFSVVPVLSNGRIYLRLVEVSAPFGPITPKSQVEAFRSRSRLDIYSQATCLKVESITQNLTSVKSQSGHPSIQAADVSTSSLQTRLSEGSQLATTAVTNLVNEENIRAAKEVAGAAARSLFSFAAASIKNVSEVASSIKNDLSGGSNLVVLSNVKVVIMKELAEGGFGKVYVAQEQISSSAKSAAVGKLFALKQMLCQSREQEEDAHRELQALQRFSSHENIINLLDSSSYVSKQHNNHRIVNMLFPLCHQGSLASMLDSASDDDGRPWPFPERRALVVILGIARALDHIHSMGFSHRDVKPHNFLFAPQEDSSKRDPTPLLTDLGSISVARLEVVNRQQALTLEDEAAVKTSAAYRSPELTSVSYPSSIDERVDIWGLGCALFALAFGRSPFESAREGVLRLAILNGRFSFPSSSAASEPDASSSSHHQNQQQNQTNSHGQSHGLLQGACNIRGCRYSEDFCAVVRAMLQPDIKQRPFARDVAEMAEDRLRMLGR